MFEAIPCVAHEIPTPIVQDNEDHHGNDEEHEEEGSHEGGQLIGYKPIDPANPTFPGAVVCIEGLAYGDGQDEEDYSELVGPSLYLSLVLKTTGLLTTH
jgi:snRNA-activating protein complex subunit 3